jgi:DNA-binding NarL/FixJ family response regulator
MIRLLCIEDDPLTRTYLTYRLKAETDMLVVNAVSDIRRALQHLRLDEIDVLLLDYQLQGEEGTSLVQSMCPWSRWGLAGDQRPFILFCTGYADASFRARARLLGARGVVAKECMARDLVPAVRAVADGGEWFV